MCEIVFSYGLNFKISQIIKYIKMNKYFNISQK